LERNFGYAVPPYPEELLNVSGYMQMDMGNLEKSEMYFEQAGTFSQSANAMTLWPTIMRPLKPIPRR
jgi:hypothetical protein